ncbi:ATP-binding protein [Arcticibacter sp. MXS-1]|uniref:ATP-binding protein n=1 Tax=Arcticibacter sp. MXS-1 TaxID=3341726 RepID=UPI0035A8C422
MNRETKLRAILQNAPVGLVEIDEHGSIIEYNLVAAQLLSRISQMTPEPGKSLYQMLTVAGISLGERIKRSKACPGLIVSNEMFTLNRAENEDWFFVLTATRMFEGCIIVSIEDVTSRLREEKALQQAEQDKAVAQGKYELASEVLHDIGNAVVGFGSYLTRISRALEQDNSTALANVVVFLKERKEAITAAVGLQKSIALINLIEGVGKVLSSSHVEIKTSVTEQLQIITHIQEILTIQRQYVNGQPIHERKLVNLREIIYDCRSMLLSNLEKKGISLVISAPDQVTIKGDRTKLMQVLLNIFKNSIEAIDECAPAKRIDVRLELSQEKIWLKVKDTGSGFPQEKGETFFKRGFTTKEKGTGLGLYSCRSIVESHGGTITLHSAGIGQGSTVVVQFQNLI